MAAHRARRVVWRFFLWREFRNSCTLTDQELLEQSSLETMFDSSKTSILWEKSGPLAIMWIAANLGTVRITGLKLALSKREYARADVMEACALILSPKESLHLRLCAQLLLGIVRVHNKQAHYVLMDMNDLRRKFDLLHSLTLVDHTARFDAITLPEADFNLSLSSVEDLSFLSSFAPSKAGYIDMDADGYFFPVDEPQSPSSELGSMKRSPTEEETHTVADIKNISIEEHVIESPNSTLNDSLMESMYFGDEDPQLLAEHQQAVNDNKQSITEQDEVLLFDEEANDFSFCDGSSGEFVNPLASPLELPSLATSSPHPDNQQVMKTPSRLEFRKKRRRQYKDELHAGLIIDEEIGLNSHAIKLELNNVRASTRELKLAKLKPPRTMKAEQLLFRPFTEENAFPGILYSRLNMKLSRQLIVEIGKDNQISTHTSGKGTDILTLHNVMTPNGRTLFESDMTHKDSDFTGSNLEVEMMRNGLNEDEMSYEDPLRNASVFSGDSNTTIRSGQSFQISTAQRLKLDNGRDPPPPTMGGLSPILDVDEEMDLSGNFGLPDLDDTYGSMAESFTSQQVAQTTSRSPFIESEPYTYGRHVASVMENREQLSFSELLPRGSSKKTASKAFSHILVLLSTLEVLEAEQAIPYGPIILKRGKDF